MNYNYYPMTYQQQSQQGITWVQGEEAAKAQPVAAGNSVILMDSEEPVFYIKTTDASGMPMPLKVYEYHERAKKPSEYISREEFEERLAELMERKVKKAKKKEEQDAESIV